MICEVYFPLDYIALSIIVSVRLLSKLWGYQNYLDFWPKSTPGPQNLPKLVFQKLFLMPRTILNLLKTDFHENVSLGEQLLQLTFFDNSTNFQY